MVTLKRCIFLFALTLVMSGSTGSKGSDYSLKEGFANPPREARPYVWWHWMNGNVTKDGIRKDLEWMSRAGIGGFHHFDAAIGVPQIVENRMVYMHDDWKDAFRYAIALGDSLGMEMSVASSPGWSLMGGPWVPVEDAMKKIVWRTMYIKGGALVNSALPEPFDVPGKFQNMPVNTDERYYSDIAVLALKLPDEDKPLSGMSVKITSSSGTFTLDQLTNEDLDDAMVLQMDKTAGYAWIQYEFPEPTPFRSVSVADGRMRTWGYLGKPALNACLEISDDGVSFTEVAKIPSTHCCRSTVSFPEVKAKYYRFRMDGLNDQGAKVSEFNLYTTGRLHHAEEKACFCCPYDIHDYPTVTDGPFASEVIDVTENVNGGMLSWNAPEGNWKILRIGCSLTGRKNGPAPAEARGLEVDKLDPDAFSRYFHKYLDMYKEATNGMIGARGIQYILTDSYEAGCQTWTPNMAEAFRKRCGYDLIHWLPVLTGEIVESVERSEAFIFDWATTISDLYSNNYNLLTDIVKEYGMKGRYSESHEHGRALIADGMDIKRTSSIPMSACWAPGSRPMAAADIRESASVAHIYGQNIVAAESMTAHGTDKTAYSFSPRTLKFHADWELANGVNRIIVHESAHQPSDTFVPGLGLGLYGQWFNRHETWAEQAKVWTDYLARSCYMLQQGQAVADILVYYGEDSNVCSQESTSKLPDYIPVGFNYDYAGPSVIKMASAKKGCIVAGNMKYRILYLNKNMGRVSVDIMRKLVKLAKGGVSICGHTPLAPAGLMDDKAEWNDLLAKLKAQKTVHLEETPLQALERLGIKADVSFDPAEKINYVHRHLPETDFYWVSRPGNTGKTMEISFRIQGRRPQVWHPDTGIIEDVSYCIDNGRTSVKLNLTPDDAVFVVFSDRTKVMSSEVKPVSVTSTTRIDSPWTVQFQENRGAPASAVLDELISYTRSADPGIKYFSGKAKYSNKFYLDAVPEGKALVLNLGTVRELACVSINGISCGTLWKEPYRVDVTNAVRPGENSLEITVINPWINRLIGDKQPSCTDKIAFTSYDWFKKDSPLHAAGLIGPVGLEVEE